jgi:hypothetical protein
MWQKNIRKRNVAEKILRKVLWQKNIKKRGRKIIRKGTWQKILRKGTW